MIAIAASFLIPWVIGLSIVNWLFPCRTLRFPLFFHLSLALGLGFGISSAILFLWLLVFGEFHWAFKIVELLICLMGIAGLLFQKIWSVTNPGARLEQESDPKIEKMLAIGFFLSFFFGLVIINSISLYYPHGNWDAWAIWNNRARFIFRSGSHWLESFSPVLGWSHPDYPLLLPLAIARCWFYLGAERVWVPAVMALLFSVITIGLLVSALAAVQNKSQGYLGGILLLGTPFFLSHSASQYADVPLAFFFLSAVAIFFIYDQTAQKCSRLLVLGGLLSGFSAWTKNEGLLFVTLLLLVRLPVTVPNYGWKGYGKNLAFFMVGLLPIVSFIGFFKFFLSPSNDIISLLRTDQLFQKLTDVKRVFLIAKAWLAALLNFGYGPITLIPILILYSIWVGRSAPARNRTNPFLLLILQFFGYFLTFLFTPHDLKWHMDTSLDRLVIQLWPGLLFAVFVSIQTPEEASKKFAATPSAPGDQLPSGRITD
jgi:hypothetical protein